jgi:hypothetical protein
LVDIHLCFSKPSLVNWKKEHDIQDLLNSRLDKKKEMGGKYMMDVWMSARSKKTHPNMRLLGIFGSLSRSFVRSFVYLVHKYKQSNNYKPLDKRTNKYLVLETDRHKSFSWLVFIFELFLVFSFTSHSFKRIKFYFLFLFSLWLFIAKTGRHSHWRLGTENQAQLSFILNNRSFF